MPATPPEVTMRFEMLASPAPRISAAKSQPVKEAGSQPFSCREVLRDGVAALTDESEARALVHFAWERRPR